MEDQPRHSTGPQSFTWHPDYAGKTFDEVRKELTSQIDADQRQHRLAMEGAEEAEHDALASVVGLERKWGHYDFDWSEQDAGALASRILAFERERERRREMISWSEYRASGEPLDEPQSEITTPSELSTKGKGVALIVLVVVIVVILLVLVVL